MFKINEWTKEQWVDAVQGAVVGVFLGIAIAEIKHKAIARFIVNKVVKNAI